MTILRKDYATAVIPGSPEVAPVEGRPATPAYWSIERTSSYQWVDGPGITWKRVPIIYSGESAGFWTYDLAGNAVWMSVSAQVDAVIGGTLYKWVPLYLGSEDVAGHVIKQYKLVTTYVPTFHPAQPAIASVTGAPATPAQITYALNEGWNSYAISIDDLEKGDYLLFTVASGNAGAFLGVGPRSKYGQPITSFSHGILIDPGGIKAYESGVVKDTLRSRAKFSSQIRIHRQLDNSIVYVVTTEGETAVYASTVNAPLGELFIHGYLYSAGDQILSAEFLTGDVTFSAGAEIFGASSLEVQNAALAIRGSATLTVNAPTGALLTGTASLTAASTYSWGRINVSLPPLGAILADKDYGLIRASLPAMTCAMEKIYTPPSPERILGNLTPFVASALITVVNRGDITVDLPALLMKGGDFNYGEMNVTLPALETHMFDDPIPGELPCRSVVYTAGGPLTVKQDFVIVLSESGSLVDTISMSRQLALSLSEELQASGSVSFLGYFSIDCLSTLAASYRQTIYRDGLAALDEDTRVWVVNLDNGATSQYDNYGFNSLIELNGDEYGFADDGIYRLDGEDDDGADIDALIQVGKSDLGSSQKKVVINVYAGVSSDGKMLLKVDADGQEYVYEARSNSDDLKHHRFDVGRGLQGAYYDFTLLNQDGGDFDLETVVFEPVILSRKI